MVEVCASGRFEQRPGFLAAPALAQHHRVAGLEPWEPGVVGGRLCAERHDLLEASLVPADASQAGAEHHERIRLTGVRADLQRLAGQAPRFIDADPAHWSSLTVV